jgi:nucleotide-binding universal stress UspA family protein
MTIYVGIDGSEGAAEAARWAVAEGKLRSTAVVAIVAWDLFSQKSLTPDGEFDPHYDENDALAVLDSWVVAAVGDEAAARVERKSIIDLPWRALVTESDGADLLVVGARGGGGFLGLRLGSVSEKCLQHATCPVAVIHADGATTPASGRIVVGVDGSDVSALALAWGLDEARLRGALLRVVSAWDGGAIAATAMPGAMVDPQFLEDAAKEVLDHALEAADTNGLSAPVERVVEAGGAPSAILDAAKDASLIVTGSHGRSGLKGVLLGSVSRQVVHHAPCPVVVVPHPDRGDST